MTPIVRTPRGSTRRANCSASEVDMSEQKRGKMCGRRGGVHETKYYDTAVQIRQVYAIDPPALAGKTAKIIVRGSAAYLQE